MKLIWKLYGTSTVVLLLLVSLFAAYTYRQEMKIHRADTKNDLRLFGNLTEKFVVQAFRGNEDVEKLVKDLGFKEGEVRIVWHPVNAEDPTSFALHHKLNTVHRWMSGNVEHYRLFIPIVADGLTVGIVEISESLDKHRQKEMGALGDLATFALSLALLGLLLFLTLGHVLLGKRLRIFTEHLECIARGDLRRTLHLKGDDELTNFGRTLNHMTKQLYEARERLDQEADERLKAVQALQHHERLATVGRLTAGFAHELGTPMNIIDGRAKFIADGFLDPRELVESAIIIRRQIDGMKQLMNSLLDFGGYRLAHRELSDILPIIQNTVSLLSPMAAEKNCSLNVQTGDDAPPCLVDALQVQQVLSNVIMNALQAMNNAGEISVRLHHQPNATAPFNQETRSCNVITITDEGPGIDCAIMDKIFDPFFTSKDIGEGTGLGLSIVHGIMQEHNGWVIVKNKNGKGARFDLFFPIEEVTDV